MNKHPREVALLYLGLNPSSSYSKDDILDALEEVIYDEQMYFMNKDFSAKLATSRIDKISNLLDLETELLSGNTEIDDLESLVLLSSSSISKYVASYNVLNSKLKLELSRSFTIGRIIKLYQIWISRYNEFAEHYQNLIIEKVGSVDPKINKRSIDFVELINELKNEDYSGEASAFYNQLEKHKTIAS